jgi:uncharacterized protein (TIGR02147 family)
MRPRTQSLKNQPEAADSHAVLLTADTARAALQGLYLAAKAQNPRMSLAYLCRRAAIPSTGYLSYVFSGKRPLAKKYREPLLKALGLRDDAARCIRLLFAIDDAGDAEARRRLAEQLTTVRKVLAIRRGRLPEASAHHLFFAFDVFGAFGLFDDAPSEADLVGVFGAHRAEDVRLALQTLAAIDVIHARGGRHHCVSRHYVFGEARSGMTHVDFLKLGLAHAARQIDTYFGKRDEAYLASSTLSVRAQDYAALLAEVRQQTISHQARVETDSADMLIRYNVQIYPLARRARGLRATKETR